MIIELPDLEKFEKIKIKLDNPRRSRPEQTNSKLTYLPTSEQLNNRKGIYIIKHLDKIEYIGMTVCLRNRICSHINHGVLKFNSDINEILFLEIEDNYKRKFYEEAYMFIFFGRLRNADEYTYKKEFVATDSGLNAEDMKKEIEKKPLMNR